jgi:hypothetical protein
MSQTQLMLIVLGVLVIGLGIYVALSLFQSNAVDNARDAIMNDLGHYAGQARVYYSRPLSQGGGNRSFSGATMGLISTMSENANARYFVESTSDSECVIGAVGKVLSEGDSIRIRARVRPTRNIFEIIN